MKIEPVDRCEVVVLVDNVTDILSTIPASITGEVANVFKAGAKELSGSCLCCAHWGLSLVIAAERGDAKHTLLFDTGPEGVTVERNGDRLGVDFAAVDAAMFSHGHWDHVGGMIRALELIRDAKGGRATPLHVNEGMFIRRGMKTPDGAVIPFADVPGRVALEAAGAEVVFTEAGAGLLDDMFAVSGEIPRVTPYEKGLPPHVKDVGAGWEPDPWIMDERYAAVHVKDKGIIVFTACSHAGVINVLKHAREAFAPVPLYGVMGGFHLSGGACEAIIPETVEDMKQFDLQMIVPGHCTGWRAIHKLVEAFGEDRVVPSAVGRTHHF
jgi:7,8-dihydropterin-6-yl-methyl-4-(beta-D-ribofuranosyl)aminobenzene 5'-phosphate synthase